jgi:mannose-6-phosphate isomerase-like protein (cupin superfamily)
MSAAAHGAGWKSANVNEIPPVKPDWPATWKSVRHHFGITAFGINAVTKDAGNVLIPEHDETESGQQEIYFVHAGEVRATLDGEAVTIAAGGMVAIEPAVKRKIEATASPTTLIAIGACPGKAYEVGAWEL